MASLSAALLEAYFFSPSSASAAAVYSVVDAVASDVQPLLQLRTKKSNHGNRQLTQVATTPTTLLRKEDKCLQNSLPPSHLWRPWRLNTTCTMRKLQACLSTQLCANMRTHSSLSHQVPAGLHPTLALDLRMAWFPALLHTSFLRNKVYARALLVLVPTLKADPNPAGFLPTTTRADLRRHLAFLNLANQLVTLFITMPARLTAALDSLTSTSMSKTLRLMLRPGSYGTHRRIAKSYPEQPSPTIITPNFEIAVATVLHPRFPPGHPIKTPARACWQTAAMTLS